MSEERVRIVSDGRERLLKASLGETRQVEKEIRARYAGELEHAGLFDRMRIEAKIREEIRVALHRVAPPEALY